MQGNRVTTCIPFLPGLGSVLSVKNIYERSIRRLLVEVVVPQQRRAFSAERSRHPGITILN
jgi:hypothetical protein